MSFTDEEKARIRHHLGYINVGNAATFALGVPQAVETQFIIENAFNLVLPEAEHEVRRMVAYLDGIEQRMVDDLELLSVDQVGEVKVRRDEMDHLRKEYVHWQTSLANVFGITPNPYDKRPFVKGGLNVPVQH